MSDDLYARPRRGLRPEDCFFYHVMDLPGVGQVGGHWDLRDTIDDYLGHYDFAGKRVLDVGTASGFLTFAMEQRGAEVVSFDAACGRYSDIVPYHNDPQSLEEIYAQQEQGLEQLKNSYWYAHEKLESRAQAYYGDVHHLPLTLGHFDVAVMGAFLSHLRDPLSALSSVARLGVDRLIITQQTSAWEAPVMQLIPVPAGQTHSWSRFTWWQMSDGLFRTYLGILGYQLERLTRTGHRCVVMEPDKLQQCTTYVFRKGAPAEPRRDAAHVQRPLRQLVKSVKAWMTPI